MKPPFEIYRETDIADADGHVCTAENIEIARQIVAALEALGDRWVGACPRPSCENRSWLCEHCPNR